jgi:hypothetical protein
MVAGNERNRYFRLLCRGCYHSAGFLTVQLRRADQHAAHPDYATCRQTLLPVRVSAVGDSRLCLIESSSLARRPGTVEAAEPRLLGRLCPPHVLAPVGFAFYAG